MIYALLLLLCLQTTLYTSEAKQPLSGQTIKIKFGDDPTTYEYAIEEVKQFEPIKNVLSFGETSTSLQTVSKNTFDALIKLSITNFEPLNLTAARKKVDAVIKNKTIAALTDFIIAMDFFNMQSQKLYDTLFSLYADALKTVPLNIKFGIPAKYEPAIAEWVLNDLALKDKVKYAKSKTITGVSDRHVSIYPADISKSSTWDGFAYTWGEGKYNAKPSPLFDPLPHVYFSYVNFTNSLPNKAYELKEFTAQDITPHCCSLSEDGKYMFVARTDLHLLLDTTTGKSELVRYDLPPAEKITTALYNTTNNCFIIITDQLAAGGNRDIRIHELDPRTAIARMKYAKIVDDQDPAYLAFHVHWSIIDGNLVGVDWYEKQEAPYDVIIFLSATNEFKKTLFDKDQRAWFYKNNSDQLIYLPISIYYIPELNDHMIGNNNTWKVSSQRGVVTKRLFFKEFDNMLRKQFIFDPSGTGRIVCLNVDTEHYFLDGVEHYSSDSKTPPRSSIAHRKGLDPIFVSALKILDQKIAKDEVTILHDARALKAYYLQPEEFKKQFNTLQLDSGIRSLLAPMQPSKEQTMQVVTPQTVKTPGESTWTIMLRNLKQFWRSPIGHVQSSMEQYKPILNRYKTGITNEKSAAWLWWLRSKPAPQLPAQPTQ